MNEDSPMSKQQADKIIGLLQQILSELEKSSGKVEDLAFNVEKLRDKLVY